MWSLQATTISCEKMSPYDDDVDMDTGTVEYSGSLSVSTDNASKKKLSQESDTKSAVSEDEESNFP